ncbi:MAG: hypothetical protein LBK63_06880 [Treponema sp.]|jgi:hypothetical protein|nr:hypothetical protein [Treponema sp.]
MAKSTQERLLSFLRSKANIGQGKWWRNFRYYWSTLSSMPTNLSDEIPLGYNNDLAGLEEYAPMSDINVVKSCIDTLGSKVANQKVRPLFTPVDGDWESKRIIKQVQLFFDDLFYKQNVNKLVTKAFKLACIYDEGVLFLDPFCYKLSALSPWQASVIQSEYEYGMLTKLLIIRDQFPTTLLKKLYDVKEPDNRLYCRLEIFVDTVEQTKEIFIDSVSVKRAKYKGETVPAVFLHYNMPTNGRRATSLCDDLIRLQRRINDIDYAIDLASKNSPLNTHFVPKGDIILTQLDNGAGNVVSYTPTPGMTGTPVITAAPSFINEQYTQERQALIEQAYQIAGVSELSAQSEKPAGLDSGKALETMENVEAARFNTQMNEVIRSYVDLARIYIDCVDENEDILPKEETRAGISWKEVLKQRDLLKIEYTATASLSNDPEKRLEMLEKMSQMGILPEEKIGQYMDMPDIEAAFSEVSSVSDAVERIIHDFLTLPEKEIMEYPIPIFVDYQVLEKEVVALQNQFFGQGRTLEELKDPIGRLQILHDKVAEVLTENTKTNYEGGPEGPAAAPGQEEAQGFAPTPLTRAGGAETGPVTNDAQAAGIPAVPGGMPATVPPAATNGVPMSETPEGVVPAAGAAQAGRIA